MCPTNYWTMYTKSKYCFHGQILPTELINLEF